MTLHGGDGFIRLEIESIAAGGDGVGHVDGLVVFVPRTAPGDLARARIRAHGRFARGVLVALERPSPARVDPACPHYEGDRCGGCQLQHLELDAQHRAKAGIVRDAITRIGRRPVDGVPLVPSPKPWRYRRKLTLALRRRAGRGDRPGPWTGGLHRYDAPDEVFALRDCPITDEGVLAVWRDVLAASGAFPRDSSSLRGSVRTIEDRAAVTYAFLLEGGAAWPDVDAFRAAVPSLAEIWWTPEGGVRGRVYPGGPGPRAGAAFVQVNPDVARALGAYVIECVMARRPDTVVDGYSGTGHTAVSLAERGMRVTAIERDADAVTAAAGRLPAGSRAIAGRVEDVLPTVLPADLVVLNPPRAGLGAEVSATLQTPRLSPKAIVYVSCDPATLARDIARLARYRVASLRAFDMFPQTAHVETVCELVTTTDGPGGPGEPGGAGGAGGAA